jgi:DNA-binding transcriptional ArsR family regulator
MPRPEVRTRHVRPTDSVLTAAAMFAALGDGTRLRLLMQLQRAGAQSITRLTAGAGISRQAITKHLRALERVQLVHGARRGREHLWELRAQRLQELLGVLEQISGQWDRALERLRSVVET